MSECFIQIWDSGIKIDITLVDVAKPQYEIAHISLYLFVSYLRHVQQCRIVFIVLNYIFY